MQFEIDEINTPIRSHLGNPTCPPLIVGPEHLQPCRLSGISLSVLWMAFSFPTIGLFPKKHCGPAARDKGVSTTKFDGVGWPALAASLAGLRRGYQLELRANRRTVPPPPVGQQDLHRKKGAMQITGLSIPSRLVLVPSLIRGASPASWASADSRIHRRMLQIQSHCNKGIRIDGQSEPFLRDSRADGLLVIVG